MNMLGAVAFLVALSLAPAHAFLGGTPEECEEIYGQPVEVALEGAQTHCAYNPTLSGFADSTVHIQIVFLDGEAVLVRFQIYGKQKITPLQFSLLAGLNGSTIDNLYEAIGERELDGKMVPFFRMSDGSAIATQEFGKKSDFIVSALKFWRIEEPEETTKDNEP